MTEKSYYWDVLSRYVEHYIDQEATEVPALLRCYAPQGDLVLDLGAGTGRLTGILASQSNVVIAVDHDLQALQILNESQAGDVFPILTKAQVLPFAPEVFDFVVSAWVFQSIRDSDVAAVAGEVYRILKPGGTTAIEIPNELGDEVNLKAVFLKEASVEARHKVDRLIVSLQTLGMSVREVKYQLRFGFDTPEQAWQILGPIVARQDQLDSWETHQALQFIAERLDKTSGILTQGTSLICGAKRGSLQIDTSD